MTSLVLDRPRSTNILASLTATSDSFSLLILRVALAAVVLPHGLQKVFGWFGGWGLHGTLAWFASIGIPAALGVLAIAADFAGSLALIAGLGARVAAFGIGVNMVVAALVVHRPNGFFMNWAGAPRGEGYEFHILAAAMALVLVLGGAGRWSIDRFLAARKQ